MNKIHFDTRRADHLLGRDAEPPGKPNRPIVLHDVTSGLLYLCEWGGSRGFSTRSFETYKWYLQSQPC